MRKFLAGLFVLVSPVLAHHGTNISYDHSKPTILNGTVTEFVWSNPHCQLYFDVKDVSGKVTGWAGELNSPSVLGREGWLERLTGNANPSLSEVVRKYLTPRHRDDAGHGCLFAALGSDVVRQPRSVRRAFTDGLRQRVEVLRQLVPGRSAAARRHKALATMAGLVGALVLSRAVDDPKLSDEILEAVAASLSRS